MPRIIPEPRYFSMPSIDVGAEVCMKRDLNCWPWVRSLTHSPDAVTYSPAAITAAWPMTVINSRWPRALMRRTQKPFSALWKVTRSTKACQNLPGRRFQLGLWRAVHEVPRSASPTYCGAVPRYQHGPPAAAPARQQQLWESLGHAE